MTVIAWDGKTLAADKRSVSYGHASPVTKIKKSPCGALLACSGSFSEGLALMQWYMDGAVRADFPNNRDADGSPHATMMVIRHGTIEIYECTPHPMAIEAAFTGMGSGRDYALAAMHLGCDAVRAVEVACALDTGCGNGIDTLTLD